MAVQSMGAKVVMGNEETSTGPTSTRRLSDDGLFAVTFASGAAPVILVDRDRIVVGWNRAAERRFGWSASDIVGHGLDATTPMGAGDLFGSAVDAVVQRRPIEPFAATCFAKDGQPMRLWVHVAPIVTDEGDVVAVAISTRDDAHDQVDADPERLAAERFRRIFAAKTFGICCGIHDRVTDANAAFLASIGASDHDLRDGLALGTILAAGTAGAGPIVDGEGREFDITRPDGTSAHLFAAVVSLGSNAGWVGLTVDLTERKAAERAVAHLALHDPVTGLPNRRLLIDSLEQALSRAMRRDRHVALLFCDVDRFKQVNDTHGHRVGDDVLRVVARRLESVLRGDDAVARVGGDEFVVVLQELSDPTEATRIAERARLALSDPIPLEDARNSSVRVTASIGVAISSPPHDDGERLLRRADDAMYLAKQQGRDQIAFADPAFTRRDARFQAPSE